MPKQGKKKNGRNSIGDEQQKQQEEAESSSKLRHQQEKERQQKWTESWDRKIREEERLEDCKACCAPDDFFQSPRAQSNIWIQINHEKNSQQVQMSFKNSPVPKPKPPPLPRLKIIDVPKVEEESDSKPITDGKKKKK